MIPLAPGAVPVLGHLPRLVRDPLAYLDTLAEHGDVLSLRLGKKNIVVVCDAKLTHELLVADDVFDKGGPFMEAGRRLMPSGIAVALHDDHRRLRKQMQPSFTRGRFPAYGEIMTKEIEAAVTAWRDGSNLDVVQELTTITGRVLTATMFSSSVPLTTVRQISLDAAELTRQIMVETMLPASLARIMPGSKRTREAVARLRETTLQLIAERRAEGTAGTAHGDLLSALLAVPEHDGELPMSDVEIVDQLTLMLVAGTETSAHSVSWALYELSRRPELEAALHAEVDQVLSGRPAEYADIPQLGLTNRIMAEVLRFYSPGWIYTRRTTVDTKLGRYPIPAGTDVIYSPYIIDRSPSVHENARVFDPERWLPDNAGRIAKESYIPFGAGARKCIGDQFSLVESSLTLATIAAWWRLESMPGRKVRPSTRTTVVTPNGLRLRAVRRTT